MFSVRVAVKRLAQIVALVLAFPAAVLSLFGRLEPLFTMFAHMFAVAPGMPGSYLRAAYYRLVCESCSQDVHYGFGTILTRRGARISRNVSIGNYCVIGNASIGEGCQISSLVNIPSGKHDHPRDENGRWVESVEGRVTIGDYVFVAASVVVIANVGEYSTIGAGSIVVKDIPPRTVAVGNPARPIGSSVSAQPA